MFCVAGCKIAFLSWTVAVLFLPVRGSFVQFDRGKRESYREKVKSMFYHAYNSYLDYAFPYDELRPLTCDGVDTWGSYSLTLIDALDTLAVMGNYSEFRRVVSHLSSSLRFEHDGSVSVFETNIRVVGGLLAAHLLSKRAEVPLEPGWPCSGPLLRLAELTAHKILPAFDTATGMPYGTVNLLHGVPVNETPITCTAGVGTFVLEFGALSRLTGDPVFEEAAMKAMRSLWLSRSKYGLVGNHINVQTAQWTALDGGIGAGVDSYYEYLAKGASAFQNTELMAMFLESLAAIQKHVNRNDWYFWVSSVTTQITMAIFQSLEAFWPGVLASSGDASSAYRSILHYFSIWRHYGATPEFQEIVKGHPVHGREGYPLRPELIESIYHLYRVTKDPMLLHMGAQIYESIERIAKVPCGYATIKDVRNHKLENCMESFFLAETTKYLYLLFDEENFIHNDDGVIEIHDASHGECVLSNGNFVFNTEAHPLDLSGIQCCSSDKKDADLYASQMQQEINIPFLLGLTKDGHMFGKKEIRTGIPADRSDTPTAVEPLEIVPPISVPAAAPPPQRGLHEYCQCDVILSDFARICVRGWKQFVWLIDRCPARFCPHEDVVVSRVPDDVVVTFYLNHSEFDFPHVSPELLSCELVDNLDMVLYGEINPA